MSDRAIPPGFWGTGSHRSYAPSSNSFCSTMISSPTAFSGRSSSSSSSPLHASCTVRHASCLQVTHFTDLAKAAWATRDREQAVELEQAADVAQKAAILTAKAAESSWREAQATDAEGQRLAAAVHVRSSCSIFAKKVLNRAPPLGTLSYNNSRFVRSICWMADRTNPPGLRITPLVAPDTTACE